MKKSITITVLLLLPQLVLGANAAYYKERGDTERTQRNRLEAIEWYKKSIRANKNYVPALTALGSILRQRGDTPSSLRYLRQAHKLEPKNEEVIVELARTYLKQNNLRQTRAIVGKGLALSPYKADFNYLIARVYVKEKRQYLAKRKLESIIKSNPGHYLSFIGLGEIYLKEKRYRRAERAFKKARLIQPENPEVFVKLADIKLHQIIDQKEDLLFDAPLKSNTFQEPINLLLNAKGFDNSLVEANMLLAKIYALSGSCSEADPYLRTVLAENERHYTALYYQGYCNHKKALSIYPRLLRQNGNDETTRFAYEQYLLKARKKRTHPDILAAARAHYRRGQNLTSAYRQVQALFEYRWAINLYPSFIKPHERLLNHYRSQRDFINIKNQLIFLRKNTGKVRYQDMYEQYIQQRRSKLFVREGISDPTQVKNPTGLFVFHFRPVDPLSNYPDAGAAISEKLIFALKDKGRLYAFSDLVRNQLYRSLKQANYFGNGGYYNGRQGKYIRNQLKELANRPSSIATRLDLNTLKYSPLKYAISGSYEEIPGGLRVNMNLVNLETGLVLSKKSMSSKGRGYLRNIAIKLADHIFRVIPFSGRVLKLSKNGALVNLGKRDGLNRRSRLSVHRNGQKVADLNISRLDIDILWARTRKFDSIYRIKAGDEVRVRLR